MHDTMTTKKQIITLQIDTSKISLDSALDQWAQDALNPDETVINKRIFRIIGKDHTLEVEIGPRSKKNPVIKSGSNPPNPYGVDFLRDDLLTPFGIASLKERYLIGAEKSPQEAFMRAARAFADDESHAKRLYNYSSKLWFMFSTPVLSNAPTRLSWGTSFLNNFLKNCFESKIRGMPISCFLNYVPDSRRGLTDHYTENAFLSSIGGGVGSYWGALRTNGTPTSGGSASSGAIPFIGVMDRVVLAFAQGVTRRASYAAYLDISHPEIIEFLEIRKPTGGDLNRKSLNIHNAVCIPDSFMEIIEQATIDPDFDDSWPLIDPHSKKVVETVSAKELWQKILELRLQTGEPYILFIDTANNALPKAQAEAGLRVYQSNLCSEITLPTNEERTAVCCLSSVNLEYFDEWSKDPLFIEDLVRMLDNVLEFFINNASKARDEDRDLIRRDLEVYFSNFGGDFEPLSEKQIDAIVDFVHHNYLTAIKKAIYSAKMERSIGLGAMGFHSLLQKKGLAFESAMATSVNRQVFSHIKLLAEKATTKLAQERGSAPDAKGELRRNMHLLAIAPNATSAILCGGTSPSCEPHKANAYTHKTQSGSWLVKNKYLEQVLDKKGLNTEETWNSILLNKGSVQHLEGLSDFEKDIYKTAIELDQRWIIEHAGHRQENICQAQSVNTFFPADVHVLYLHKVHLLAWKKKLKSLYYLRSESVRKADTLGEDSSQELRSFGPSISELKANNDECLSCEG